MTATIGEKPSVEKLENGHDEPAEPEIKYRGWKAMPYVIGNETFEKLGTLGTSSNLLIYLTTIFHMESATAAVVLNIFSGTTNLAPVLGGFLADTYLGRYKTLGFASVASQLGMLILTLTAAIPSLHPPRCEHGRSCQGPTPWQLAVLFSSFGLLITGAGGIRPCNLAFGADQFNPGTESGKKGISSFFNWYYFTFTTAMMFSSTVIIYIQSNVSWTLGLAIPTALMFLSCTFFFVGTPIYVKVRPEGSPFTSIAQVLRAAFAKRRLELPDDPKQSLFNPPHRSSLVSKLPHTEQFRALDKAAIVTPMDEIKPNGSAADPWRLRSLQQVEEVKCIARIIPVWSTSIIFHMTLAQQHTYVVYQALQSDRHFGKSNFQIPAASFTAFTMLAMTAWIPVYDRIIVPRFRKITGIEGGITLLQRMGVGIILSVAAMVVSGLVEEQRRAVALHRPTLGTASSGGPISSMSSFWLVPQLVLLGLAEAFSVVGQVEFNYRQFPENMRSAAGSILFCGLACGSYLSGLMVSVVHRATGRNGSGNWLAQDLNRGRLDYFYYSLAMIGAINFAYFVICAKWYRYKVSDDGSSEIALGTDKLKPALV